MMGEQVHYFNPVKHGYFTLFFISYTTLIFVLSNVLFGKTVQLIALEIFHIKDYILATLITCFFLLFCSIHRSICHITFYDVSRKTDLAYNRFV